jgi:hypothetical protein
MGLLYCGGSRFAISRASGGAIETTHNDLQMGAGDWVQANESDRPLIKV